MVIPSNPYDAKGLLKSSIRDNDPVIFMESEVMYMNKGEVPEGEYLIPIGKAKVLAEGNDVTIVSFGKMVNLVLETAEELKKEGISPDIIDLRTVKPMDYKTIIESVKKTNRLVVVEESWPVASLSTDISHHVQHFAFDYLDAPVYRVNCLDVPLPYAPTLVENILPNKGRIIRAVKSVMYID